MADQVPVDDGEPMRLRHAVRDFRGPYWLLSNFSADPVVIDGERYPTVEHYFQAMKTENPDEREQVRLAETPDEAKRLGRAVTMVADWHERRAEVMRRALAVKFTPDSEPGRLLLATGYASLVEGNDWGDQLWGVSDGAGRNLLGVLLTERRGVLREALDRA